MCIWLLRITPTVSGNKLVGDAIRTFKIGGKPKTHERLYRIFTTL